MGALQDILDSFSISLNSIFTSYRRIRARKRPCLYIHNERTFEISNSKDSEDGIYTSPAQSRRNHKIGKLVRCLNNNKDYTLIHRDIIETLDFGDLFRQEPNNLKEQILEDVAYDTYRRQMFNLTKNQDQPKAIFMMIIALLLGILIGVSIP
jgi:hypothetical protein